MNTVTFDIFFCDLNKEAQKELCTLFQTTAEDENWDIQPLAVIEREMEM